MRPTVGEKFGSWTVESEARRQGRRLLLFCRCNCGHAKDVRSDHLRSGLSKSCGGCGLDPSDPRIRRGNKPGCPAYNKVHGDSRGRNGRAPEYTAWSKMKDRCYNPNNNRFQHYGGRGIAVCDRWRNDYRTFLTDVGRKPAREFSIDRIDVNGGYEPSNVRWATPVQQRANRTDSF